MLFILFTCKINYGYCLVSDHDIYIFNLMLPSYSFKTKFKFDEKFNAKGMQNNGIWNHTAKGYWENNPFLNLPFLRFDFHLQNGNFFLKTISPIKIHNKTLQGLFQIKNSWLIFIKIFAITLNYFFRRQILQIILYISKSI